MTRSHPKTGTRMARLSKALTIQTERSCPMKAMLVGVAVLLLTASTAYANANDDGNAALEALNAGDNDRAVMLFTRAIASHELSRADREFALANRGGAYAKEGRIAEAIDDFDQARKMKPDDTDA